MNIRAIKHNMIYSVEDEETGVEGIGWTIESAIDSFHHRADKERYPDGLPEWIWEEDNWEDYD